MKILMANVILYQCLIFVSIFERIKPESPTTTTMAATTTTEQDGHHHCNLIPLTKFYKYLEKDWCHVITEKTNKNNSCCEDHDCTFKPIKSNEILIGETKFCVDFYAKTSGTNCGCHGDPNHVIVQTLKGDILGVKNEAYNGNKFYSFYGIPFAKPPVGALRFKEPEPLPKWTGVRDGRVSGPLCIQTTSFTMPAPAFIHGQEDCLLLNVHSPVVKTPVAEKLPVFVCFHGGGFALGGALLCGPRVLLNEDVIFVAVQYRLNIFGFLSTEEAELPGNMGLKDQNIALQWVQNNIDAFGGDPNKVTLGGISAGGASVHFHMLSPRSAGLFRSGIMQSGNALCPWSINGNHKTLAKQLGDTVGCNVSFGSANFLQCMQQVDAMAIANYYNAPKWGLSTLVWVPRVDGDFIPDSPDILMKEGRFNKVNLIMGVNRDEGGSTAIGTLVDPILSEDITTRFEVFGPQSLMLDEEEVNPFNITNTVYSHYFGNGEQVSIDTIDNLEELFSDRYFIIAHDLTAKYLAEQVDDQFSLYLYEFDERLDAVEDFNPLFGYLEATEFTRNKSKQYVSHVDDLFLTYDIGPQRSIELVTEKDKLLRKIVSTMWNNFIKTSNPTPTDGGLDFTWDKGTKDNLQELSIVSTPIMRLRNRTSEMKFWLDLNLKEYKTSPFLL